MERETATWLRPTSSFYKPLLPKSSSSEFSKMKFQDLPMELKFRIFSYFKYFEIQEHIALVCDEWKIIAEEPIFWTTIELNGSKQAYNQMVDELNRHYLVRKLEICGVREWDWIKKLPQLYALRQLEFKECAIDGLSFSHIIEHCPLVCEFNNIIDINVRYDLIAQILRWEGLTRLELGNLVGDSGKSIDLIAEKCKNLQKVAISMVEDKIIDNSVSNLFYKRGANLTSLRLNIKSMTDRSYTALSKCPLLTQLVIVSAKEMTDVGLMALKDMQYLKSLVMNDCSNVTADGFQHFFQGASFLHLKRLVLDGCVNFSNKSTKAFGQCCPNLTLLFIVHSPNTTDEGVQAIVTSCRKLSVLRLTELSKVTGTWLKDIRTNLPNLASLVVTRCHLLNDDIVKQFIDENRDLYVCIRNH